ncbi:MAG: ABC transporter ATP-binding protein [Acetobacteraceae bacterium]|nr:ABC transporter ATP-binding protein [Acetobacteraceae bacterium]
MLLELDGLSSGYGRFQVLRDVSLAVNTGEIVALIGANGAGKSTLLNTVMGLVARSQGEIRFDGKQIAQRPTPAIVRSGIAQVPERRQLFGTMTVEENLRMGAYACADRRAVPRLLDEQYARFPILGERRRQLAKTMSGGQQQMVAIARAMMSQPRLLLLDEPSLGLAPLVVAQIMREIVALRAAQGTVLIVEQNAHAALTIADRGYVLEQGRITASGASAELLHSPAVQDAYLGGRAGQRAIEGRILNKKRAILGR